MLNFSDSRLFFSRDVQLEPDNFDFSKLIADYLILASNSCSTFNFIIVTQKMERLISFEYELITRTIKQHLQRSK